MNLILIDATQLFITNIITNYDVKDNKINVNKVRTNLIKQLNKFYKKFEGEILLCFDSQVNYWRKDYFRYYKLNRLKTKNSSPNDWGLINSTLLSLKDEFKDNLPFKVLLIDGAECDDIIAVLTSHYTNSNIYDKIYIISNDKDFKQLLIYQNVFILQFNKWILLPEIEEDRDKIPLLLKEHILKGDSGDGIPNILSQDDCLVCNRRQRPLLKSVIGKWVNLDYTEFCNTPDIEQYYIRNRELIDFSYIPEHIKNSVLETNLNTNTITDNFVVNTYLFKYQLPMLEICLKNR